MGLVGPPSYAKATDGRKGPHCTSFRSGRRESNPVYIHPMDAYYRYTTARLALHSFSDGGFF